MRNDAVSDYLAACEPSRSAASILEGLSRNVAKFEGFATNMNKLTSDYISAWQVKDLSARGFDGYISRHARDIQQISTTLTRSQLGWLTKGFRAWNDHAADWLAVEVKGLPTGVFDLETFLLRRQLEGLRRRANWAGRAKRGRVRAWLLSLGKSLFSRVAQRLARAGAQPLHFFAPPGAGPPGWFATLRHRRAVEAALPKIIDQLAEVMAPNAPAPDLDLPTIPAGA